MPPLAPEIPALETEGKHPEQASVLYRKGLAGAYVARQSAEQSAAATPNIRRWVVPTAIILLGGIAIAERVTGVKLGHKPNSGQLNKPVFIQREPTTGVTVNPVYAEILQQAQANIKKTSNPPNVEVPQTK